MQTLAKYVILLFLSTKLIGQGSEIKVRIDVGELKMTFPSIYFKHNSTEYAEMPYTVDSCFKHIATNIKDVTGKPIWRDSAETEQLTSKRIKKIKTDLSKYTSKKLAIESMKTKQKISRRTINIGVDSEQVDYLLSLNSVFDIAKTRFPKTGNHGLWIFGTCWRHVISDIFTHGSWLNRSGREHCRMDRRRQQKSH
jgi:hypothetical protein